LCYHDRSLSLNTALTPQDAEIPPRLGRYEIVERLAAGGMGEVFLARVVGAGGFMKPVALKRIHPQLARDREFIEMLYDEANVAAGLQHPNIVRTIDVGSEGDNHYVVLDYVNGEPIGRLHRELKKSGRQLPPWLVAWVGAQVASALHAAHEGRSLDGQRMEIIHRDVSPSNIMLSDEGHAMLFDFGVAKAKQRLHHTTHGELKGKLPYMAPETFAGMPADRTVDIFALGVVLYELLTDISPFKRDTDVECIAALLGLAVPPANLVRGEVDPRLAHVVAHAMERNRGGRFATAAQLESALRTWATSTGAPHDASAVATWVEECFPQRLHKRREMLRRVADPATRPLRAAPLGPAGGTGDPSSGLHSSSGVVQARGMMASGSAPGSMEGVSRSSGYTPWDAADAAASYRAAARSRRSGFLVAGAVALMTTLLGGAAVLLLGRGPASADANPGDPPSGTALGPVATGGATETPSEPATGSATGASSADSAPSASAAASAGAGAPRGTGRLGPTPRTTSTATKTGGKKGPLAREYD
jgi:serine/threonine protein kinase